MASNGAFYYRKKAILIVSALRITVIFSTQVQAHASRSCTPSFVQGTKLKTYHQTEHHLILLIVAQLVVVSFSIGNILVATIHFHATWVISFPVFWYLLRQCIYQKNALFYAFSYDIIPALCASSFQLLFFVFFRFFYALYKFMVFASKYLVIYYLFILLICKKTILSLWPCPHWRSSTNKAFETFTEPGVSFMYFNHHTISVQADRCLETVLLQKFECTNSYSPASGWSGTTRRAANFTSLAMFGLASLAPFPSTVVLSEKGSLPPCTVPGPVHGLSSSACGAA